MIHHFECLKKNKGFSLLEILVAFAILVLALTAILKIYSTGARSISLSNEYSKAVKIAESIMAASGRSDPLQLGEENGVVEDQYYWKRYVRAKQDQSRNAVQTDGIRQDQTSLVIREVDVTVYWQNRGKSRAVNLHSMKPALIE